MKSTQKETAIQLRRKGLSYSQILVQVPVAKSTLSLWLREVGLSKPQRQVLTKRRIEAALRGAEAKRKQRIATVEAIQSVAMSEIKSITKRELWLMGVMLYWAEGSKEKEGYPGSSIDFSNSDPRMIRLFLRWLKTICNIESSRIHFGIYIHENSKSRMDDVIRYWASQTSFPKKQFTYIYFKRHNPKTKRKNIGDNYFGNLRVGVRASSALTRKVEGWVKGIDAYYCRVV